MNNQTYTVSTPNGKKKTYRRLTKASARRAFLNGETIVLCPSNLAPHKTFLTSNIALADEKPREEIGVVTPSQIFDFAVFQFQFYNCRTEENGRRVNFFIKGVSTT